MELQLVKASRDTACCCDEYEVVLTVVTYLCDYVTSGVSHVCGDVGISSTVGL